MGYVGESNEKNQHHHQYLRDEAFEACEEK